MNGVRCIFLFLCQVSFLYCGYTAALSPEPRWHLQRIVQRDALTREQILSGMRAFNLSSISPEGIVNIYVIDSGVLIGHEEFSGGRAIYGANIRNPRADPSDCDGHGTHVAALAAGAYSGVATSARVISVRVLNCLGRGSCSHILGAMEWVARDSAIRRKRFGERSVTVMSVGSQNNACASTQNASQLLWDSGVVIAAAAGNENTDACQLYPARNPRTLAVGAFDEGDRLYKRNNVGTCVDIFAPGVNVLSAWGEGSVTELRRKSGTSMSTPIVAGVAAILLGVEPNLSSREVKDIIIGSSTEDKILDNSGDKVMTAAVNKMVYAPWARLFVEVEMNSPETRSNEKHTAENAFPLKDPDWNSTTSFAALALTLFPRVAPAMLHSVERIKNSISETSGIRKETILARRAANSRILDNGTEPNRVSLIFYIPVAPLYTSLYYGRLLKAARSGKLQKLSQEAISFSNGSIEKALILNVSVPPTFTTVADGDRQSGIGSSRKRLLVVWISLGIVGTLAAATVAIISVVRHRRNGRQ